MNSIGLVVIASVGKNSGSVRKKMPLKECWKLKLWKSSMPLENTAGKLKKVKIPDLNV